MSVHRPAYLRETPLHDRNSYPQEWTTEWRHQVVDLFCGKGGVGRALGAWLPRRMYAGIDVEPYGDDYPGQFIQADLLDAPELPVDGIVADVAWVSFPCTAYSSLSATHYGSKEAALEANPRITDDLREWLLEHFGHYVIENVPGATRVGDLEANCRVNGLAFGKPFDLERHFETTFDVPDAYLPGEPEVTVDTRDNQSVRELANAKGVPAEWGKQAVRSAIPLEYVLWVLGHCLAIEISIPEHKQLTFDDVNASPGRYSMFGNGYCAGHLQKTVSRVSRAPLAPVIGLESVSFFTRQCHRSAGSSRSDRGHWDHRPVISGTTPRWGCASADSLGTTTGQPDANGTTPIPFPQPASIAIRARSSLHSHTPTPISTHPTIHVLRHVLIHPRRRL